MTEGSIVELGAAERVFAAPSADYTRKLLANTPTLEAALVGEHRGLHHLRRHRCRRHDRSQRPRARSRRSRSPTRRSRRPAPARRSRTFTSAIPRPARGRATRRCTARWSSASRAADIDVVLNLTAGMGGDLVLGGEDAPLPVDAAGTDMVGAGERLVHVAELRPEICTLDCGTMNFAAGGDYVMVNTPGMLRAMAARVQRARRAARARGVRHRPSRARERADPGRADRRPGAGPALHGHPVRRAGRPGHAARDGRPAAPGRCSPPSRSAGCSCRTSRWPCSRAGTSASASRTTSSSRAACSPRTAQLVERAVAILEAMNVRVLGPEEVRERLALRGTAERGPAPRVGLLGGGVIGGGWAARFC